jgi:hypothetical protein
MIRTGSVQERSTVQLKQRAGSNLSRLSVLQVRDKCYFTISTPLAPLVVLVNLYVPGVAKSLD